MTTSGTDAGSNVMVSPRIGALLTQVTEVPDLEAALWKVLSEYIDLKVAQLTQRVQEFESKWDMPFAEFAKRCENFPQAQRLPFERFRVIAPFFPHLYSSPFSVLSA